MKASITYRMSFIPHPWAKNKWQKQVNAWCLIKVIRPEVGFSKEETVAIFNLDSEAELFQTHIFMENLDGKLLSIDDNVKELIKSMQKVDKVYNKE